jgi:hypothetical protein
MSDKQAGQGPGGSDDLELTPQWGGEPATGEGKPKHVAVRKKGDIGEAMQPSAADAEYKAEIESASVQVAKERKLGFVLLAIVLIAAAGLIVWKITKVDVTVTASSDTAHQAGIVIVTSKVITSHDVKVGIEGIGDKKDVPPGEKELKFEVPLKKLKLGANPLKVQVHRDGKVLTSAEVTAYFDFEIESDTSKVANKPHNVYLKLKLPQGWKARVNQQDYEPSGEGKVSVPVSMEQIFASLDRFESPQYKLDIPVKIIRDSGHEQVHLEKVTVMLPQAKMELDDPHDAMVVAGKKAVISGKSDPGAQVKIDGAPVEVAEDGTFTAKIKLPKNKGFKITAKDLAGAVTQIRSAVEAGGGKLVRITVKTPGRVPSTREILAVRGKSKVAKVFAKLAAAAK